jgi:hypothetical protein
MTWSQFFAKKNTEPDLKVWMLARLSSLLMDIKTALTDQKKVTHGDAAGLIRFMTPGEAHLQALLKQARQDDEERARHIAAERSKARWGAVLGTSHRS